MKFKSIFLALLFVNLLFAFQPILNLRHTVYRGILMDTRRNRAPGR